MKKKILIYFLIFLSLSKFYGQEQRFGGKIGVSFNLGNKVDKIGVVIAGYAIYDFFQLNSSLRYSYVFKSLGTKKTTPEFQIALGAQFGYGKKTDRLNRFVSVIENNTNYQNSFGYTYIRYVDKIKTTQSTAIISMKVDLFTLAFENDVFAGGEGYRDRFRTGGFYMEYQLKETKIGLNSTLWTGDYSRSPIEQDSTFKSRFGYKSIKNSVYGGFSASLLSIQVQQLLPFQQVARVNVGIDEERIRNGIQNKLIHDMIILPKNKIKNKQVHIPMLTDKNTQYLYLPNQKIKNTTLYFNLGANESPFY